MIYSVNDTSEFKASVHIGTGFKTTNGKGYIYCELAYYDKANDKAYQRVYPATKFDKVLQVYGLINQGLIPKTNIPFEVRNIK